MCVPRPPPPLPRTNRTSLVPPLVLSGHAGGTPLPQSRGALPARGSAASEAPAGRQPRQGVSARTPRALAPAARARARHVALVASLILLTAPPLGSKKWVRGAMPAPTWRSAPRTAGGSCPSRIRTAPSRAARSCVLRSVTERERDTRRGAARLAAPRVEDRELTARGPAGFQPG